MYFYCDSQLLSLFFAFLNLLFGYFLVYKIDYLNNLDILPPILSGFLFILILKFFDIHIFFNFRFVTIMMFAFMHAFLATKNMSNIKSNKVFFFSQKDISFFRLVFFIILYFSIDFLLFYMNEKFTFTNLNTKDIFLYNIFGLDSFFGLLLTSIFIHKLFDTRFFIFPYTFREILNILLSNEKFISGFLKLKSFWNLFYIEVCLIFFVLFLLFY